MVSESDMMYLLYMSFILFNIGKSSANEKIALQEREKSLHMSSLKKLCPYNQFCQSSPLKSVLSPDENEPCCETCSCEEDCFETGSCCPDMSLLESASIKYPCKHLAHFGKNAENIISDSDIIMWYHVIDDCPDISSATSHLRCYKPIQVQDYAIVSDEKTGKLYRNKHCAECNRIKEYVMLKLQVKCSGSLTNFSSTLERDHYLLEKCSLLSFPPGNLFRKSHCIPKTQVIRACNVTGKWKVYDRDLESACFNKHQAWRTIFRRLSNLATYYTYFANVFCFLCNTAESKNKIDICEKETRGTKGKSGYLSLVAFLDSNQMDVGMVNEDTLCDSFFIWDHFTKSCRQVICPVGHVPFYGICKGLINIYGYQVSLQFDLTFRNATFADYPVLLQVLDRRLANELGSDINCGKCEATIFSFRNSTASFLYQYEIFTNEKCPFDVLMQRLQKLVIKTKINHSFRYKNRIIDISLVYNFGNSIIRDDFSLVGLSLNIACTDINYLDESILQYCPKIVLSEHEISEHELNNSITLFANRYHRANVSQSAAYQVCVDTYLSIKQTKSSSTDCMMYLTFNNLSKLLALSIWSFSLKHTLSELI